jgi:hypothetical protein
MFSSFRRTALLALVGGICAFVAFAAPAGASGPSLTFTDPTGDAGTAADITTVSVSNDANGQITFQINIANQFAKTNTVDLLIDADRNASTGDQQSAGAEYDVFADFGQNSWSLGTWNGSSWVDEPSSSTVSVGHSTNVLTISINRSDLGNTSGFNFWIDSCDADCSAGHEDQAPSTGTWSYQLDTGATSNGGGGGSGTAVHLSVFYLLAPKTVKAGHDYSVGMVVNRSDTSGFLGSEGTSQCKATLGGKPIALVGGQILTMTVHGAKVSAAVCDWHLPKSAQGKTIKGTITASYQGASVSRPFSARVV